MLNGGYCKVKKDPTLKTERKLLQIWDKNKDLIPQTKYRHLIQYYRTGDSRGFNKGRSSKFREGSRVRQTPEEGQRTYRPKCYGNNNKDEDNSLKTLNDENILI